MKKFIKETSDPNERTEEVLQEMADIILQFTHELGGLICLLDNYKEENNGEAHQIEKSSPICDLSALSELMFRWSENIKEKKQPKLCVLLPSVHEIDSENY